MFEIIRDPGHKGRRFIVDQQGNRWCSLLPKRSGWDTLYCILHCNGGNGAVRAPQWVFHGWPEHKRSTSAHEIRSPYLAMDKIMRTFYRLVDGGYILPPDQERAQADANKREGAAWLRKRDFQARVERHAERMHALLVQIRDTAACAAAPSVHDRVLTLLNEIGEPPA